MGSDSRQSAPLPCHTSVSRRRRRHARLTKT